MLSAWQASSPHHGPGRDNKVGKEEMLGMLAAVEAWTTRDHEKEWDRWMDWLNLIADKATKIKGVSYKINLPEGLNNRAPNLVISWDPAQFNITGAEVAELFGRSEPRIAIGSGGKDGVTSINVTPSQMQDGEAKVVANRLYDTLSEKRPAPDTSLAAPSGNIAGRWDINMSFFSSESTHHMILEQDGNWLNGTHKSDFAEQDVYGTIEGDTIKIRSHFRKPGDSVVYTFTGKLKNGEWSGEVFMGEYLTANFTAKKWESKKRKQQITVPGGPPLAT